MDITINPRVRILENTGKFLFFLVTFSMSSRHSVLSVKVM